MPLPLILGGLASGALALLQQKKVQTAIGGLVGRLLGTVAKQTKAKKVPKPKKAKRGITLNF